MNKLNLGSGGDYREGWVNIDCRNNVKLDVKHDLNKFPYPFRNSEFDEILMKMTLEHFDDPIKVLREAIRISKDGARIVVIVPHAISYANIADIQHKANFTENSFSEFHLRQYDPEELKLVRQEFIFANRWKRYIPGRRFLKIFLNGVYDDLLFEFRVNKNASPASRNN